MESADRWGGQKLPFSRRFAVRAVVGALSRRRPGLEPFCKREGNAVDRVEAIWPRRIRRVARNQMIASHFLRPTGVETYIPARHDVAPLQAGAQVQAVRRRREIVA